jgi:hypothetical protein
LDYADNVIGIVARKERSTTWVTWYRESDMLIEKAMVAGAGFEPTVSGL